MERKKCKEDGKACWVKEQFLSLWPHPGKGEERRDSLKKKLREIVKGLLNNARVFRLCPARAGGIRDLLSRGMT